MAFCCLQELRHRLRSRRIHHTQPELLAILENTRLVLMDSSSRPDQRIVITQPLTKKVRDILRTVGVAWPSHSFVIPKTSAKLPLETTENSNFVVPQNPDQEGPQPRESR